VCAGAARARLRGTRPRRRHGHSRRAPTRRTPAPAGGGAEGPTLELFEYAEPAERGAPAANRPGFTHIAFSVADVAEARAHVLAHGGRGVGEVVTSALATGARVSWCYVADPEGNLIELQSWL
jgi:catechol 2,3-dioxygenase-like lactoylglutathione lyase family enzyme